MRSGLVVLGGFAALSPACSFTPGVLPIDGRTIDTSSSADAPPQTFGWSTPRELTELSHPAGADDPSLTDDLREIYFGSKRPGGMSINEDIWMASRSSPTEPFGTPIPVMELNSTSAETTIKVTGDGLGIFFASDRAGGTSGFDIWFSSRTSRSAPWNFPQRVLELSSFNGDWAAFAQSTLRRVVLCSGATESAEALFVSTRASTAEMWTVPQRIDEIDVPDRSECDPIEPNSFALYYGTDYLNEDTPRRTFDIYRVERTNEGTDYGLRTALSINVPGFNDRDPWVSADERTMVFTSDRNGRIDALFITTR